MKKIILRVLSVTAVLALAFCCAAAIVPEIRSNEDAETVFASRDELSLFRQEREAMIQMQMGQLDEIIEGGEASAELAEDAQREKLELLRVSREEKTLSGILEFLGYHDAAACVSKGSATIFIRGNEVTQPDANRILESAVSQTGLNAGEIKIIPIK